MTASRKRTLWAAVGSAALLALGAARAEPPPATDPLVALNDASRAAYKRAKGAALARTGPVILVEGDNLVLKNGDWRTEARFIPEVFHILKAVSHVPLALNVMLGAVPEGGRIGDDLLDELRRYRALIVSAEEAVGAARLGPGQAERQAAIVSESLKFLDAAAAARACGRDARTSFARRVAPLVTANTAEAARAALDSLHRLVADWRGRMAAGEWDRLTVVVMGRQLPRKDNLAVQYFARLLGEPGEGGRLVYAESLFDEPKALDLLATRLVDAQVGLDFFNDPARMQRDLLGDAAREYLPRLFEAPGRP